MANKFHFHPTIRRVAERAGVSSATVSLVLRNKPRISAATRIKVRQAADELGYRPDPQIAKLMHHLRSTRRPAFQSSIAALTTVPVGHDTPYMTEITSSARARAQQLGYGFTVFRINDPATENRTLQKVLRNRGVEGILLLPIAIPCELSSLLAWSEFSVVTTTHGVLAPRFHRVVPHQLGNALEICRRVTELGYRRIGLVLPSDHDVRVHHGLSAAVAWQATNGGTEFVQPLLHDGALPREDEIRLWYAREAPDVIITAGDDMSGKIAELLQIRVPGRVGFVSASKVGRSVFAGIDELPAEIGATAIGQLAGMIEHGNKGSPRVPHVIVIDGRWIGGRSVGPRRIIRQKLLPA